MSNNMIPESQLIEIACKVTGVTPKEHMYGQRVHKFVYSRYIAFYLLTKYCHKSKIWITELYNLKYDFIRKRLERINQILRSEEPDIKEQYFLHWLKLAEEEVANIDNNQS